MRASHAGRLKNNERLGLRVQGNRHLVFRAMWWATNLLFFVAIVSLIYSSFREYSVRVYLDGFSDAIVPNNMPTEQKVEAILSWMRDGSTRSEGSEPAGLSLRNPEVTLNYKQLLAVCGTATNGFLNLARSSDLQVRRLLLLDATRNTKHVVAEVLIGGRWIIVDPAYRMVMRDATGRMLTRSDLANPELFQQATSAVPNYPAAYTYERFAHVRIGRLPMVGLGLRRVLDWGLPGWEEKADWSLLLERESFFVLFVSALATVLCLVLRLVLAWVADRRLHVPRFHLRKHFQKVGAALFSTPEMHQ
jgi:transglutaminase superfamily protein